MNKDIDQHIVKYLKEPEDMMCYYLGRQQDMPLEILRLVEQKISERSRQIPEMTNRDFEAQLRRMYC